MKTKIAKNLALRDMREAGLRYSEHEDKQVRKCKPENPGFKFGVRLALSLILLLYVTTSNAQYLSYEIHTLEVYDEETLVKTDNSSGVFLLSENIDYFGIDHPTVGSDLIFEIYDADTVNLKDNYTAAYGEANDKYGKCYWRFVTNPKYSVKIFSLYRNGIELRFYVTFIEKIK